MHNMASGRICNDLCYLTMWLDCFYILLVRPKAIACGADLSFSPDVLFFFLSSRDLRDACADRHEILHDGQY